MAAPTFKDHGITEIYSPSDPLVDVVLVHGLNGHPRDTWTTHTEPSVFWPKQLLQRDLEHERCRILVYGYNANVTSIVDGVSNDFIHDHAATFAENLAASRRVSSVIMSDCFAGSAEYSMI